MAKIGDVCASKIDTLNAAYNGKIDYIDISAVDNDKKKITNTETLQIKEAPSRARQLVECDDIIVSLVRPNLNAVAVVENSSENLQVASTGYCVLRCNQAVYSRYLFYFCQSETFINRMTAQATGASYPAVSNSIVKNCEIPLPERNKQKEIADILDKVTGLISLRKQQLAKLDELVKARFVEMFGTYPKNENGFPVTVISDVADVSVGVVIKPAQYYVEKEVGVKAFRSLNIGPMYIKDNDWVYFSSDGNAKNRKSQLHENDLLIVRSGAPGVSCVVTKEYEGCNAIDVIIAHPNLSKVNPWYLCAYTNYPHGKKQIDEGTGGAAQQHFNVGKYSKVKIMIPPLSLQNDFAAFVERVDQQKQTTQQSLEKLELVKKALMQEYFG